eukprot:CAMPEP_0118862110 /NCGR_PEP_ID=MMETSP1163-20130328/7423_1 /TAXON_ID=124430 /ORGANISM="Phaeomonas parva, Strain CCMP2877" /LENGTH=219 /DNA_ID=CAMNT_0006795981 /DNA_START=23 /DNA_END=679 /DNA_ORIENTATION=+
MDDNHPGCLEDQPFWYVGRADAITAVGTLFNLVTLLAIIYLQRVRSNQARRGDRLASLHLVLPVYTAVLYYYTLVSLVVNAVAMLFDFYFLPGPSRLRSPAIWGALTAAHHAGAEGLAILLLHPGAGRRALGLTGVLTLLWAGVVFVLASWGAALYQDEFLLPGVRAREVPLLGQGGVRGAIAVTLVLEGLLLFFYALCALVPLDYSYLYGPEGAGLGA